MVTWSLVPLFFFAICFRDRNISTNSAFHQWQKWWSFLQRIAFDEADGHLSNLFKGRLFRSLTSFDDDTHRFLLNKVVLKFYRNDGLVWESSCFCRDCWDITDIPPKVLMACQDSTFSTLPVLSSRLLFGLWHVVSTHTEIRTWYWHLDDQFACICLYRWSRLSIKRLPFTLCSNRDSEWFIKAPPFNTHRPFGSLRSLEMLRLWSLMTLSYIIHVIMSSQFPMTRISVSASFCLQIYSLSRILIPFQKEQSK